MLFITRSGLYIYIYIVCHGILGILVITPIRSLAPFQIHTIDSTKFGVDFIHRIYHMYIYRL